MCIAFLAHQGAGVQASASEGELVTQELFAVNNLEIFFIYMTLPKLLKTSLFSRIYPARC